MACSQVHSRRRRGGRWGGRPPIWFKTSKIRANGLFIWANSLDIRAIHCQNTVSVSVQTFFFFLENTFIWTEKPFKFQGRLFFFFFGVHLNLGRKNRLNFDKETQCIKSFFGQKFAAPQIILSSYGHAQVAAFLQTAGAHYTGCP